MKTFKLITLFALVCIFVSHTHTPQAQDQTLQPISDCEVVDYVSLSDTRTNPDKILGMVCDIDAFWRLTWLELGNNFYTPPNYIRESWFEDEQLVFAGEDPHTSCQIIDAAGVFCGRENGITFNTSYLYHHGDISFLSTIAHEWAHHAQNQPFARRNYLLNYVKFYELEAECLTGAYLRYAVEHPEMTNIDISLSDVMVYIMLHHEHYHDHVNDRDTVSEGWRDVMHHEVLFSMLYGFDHGVPACFATLFEDFTYKSHIFAPLDADYSLTEKYNIAYPEHWDVEALSDNTLQLSSRMYEAQAFPVNQLDMTITWGDVETISANFSIEHDTVNASTYSIGEAYRQSLSEDSQSIVVDSRTRHRYSDYYALYYNEAGLDYTLIVMSTGCREHVAILAESPRGNLDAYHLMLMSIATSARDRYHNAVMGMCPMLPSDIDIDLDAIIADVLSFDASIDLSEQDRALLIILGVVIILNILKRVERPYSKK